MEQRVWQYGLIQFHRKCLFNLLFEYHYDVREQPKALSESEIPNMKSQEKRINKLKQVLERLSRGEIVQNRQLKTVLGTEGYARYFDDYCEQEQLREMLKDKPDEIIEYEQRLKAATFAYGKAYYKSQRIL